MLGRLLPLPGLLLLATLGVGSANPLIADDWPQWLGPNRDAVWREDGIIQEIPDNGLTVRWRAPVKWGYAGPAVADGRVFVTDYLPKAGKLENNPGGRADVLGQERILCFDAKSGRQLWTYAYDRPYRVSYPGGPRCTPTVDQGRVYTLGTEGDLLCLDADSGKLIWHIELTKKFDTETPIWGYASHPLVHGELLYCLPGGDGSVAVALDKRTGREVWRALAAPEPGYCPPTLIQHAGVQQLLIWHSRSINSLNPATGDVYWSIPLQPGFGMAIMAPRKWNDYLYASAIGNIAALMKLDTDRPGAEVLWRGRSKHAVYCSNSTPFVEDGMIYGCDVESGALMGVRLSDGERLWQTTQPTSGGRRDRHATAFLVKHDDRFFLFSEKGDLILAKLSPDGYAEQGRFHVLEPTNEAFGRPVVWSHPAFANQAIYARNDREIVCVSLQDTSP